VAQDSFILAACILQGVREDRQAVKGTVSVDAFGHRNDGGREPSGIGGHGAVGQRAEDVTDDRGQLPFELVPPLPPVSLPRNLKIAFAGTPNGVPAVLAIPANVPLLFDLVKGFVVSSPIDVTFRQFECFTVRGDSMNSGMSRQQAQARRRRRRSVAVPVRNSNIA
jgi:hypothetical protein